MIAISYGHNLAFYCTFLFFSFVSFSAVITNESIKKIDLKGSDVKVLVTHDQYSPIRLVIYNHSKKSQYDIFVEANGVSVALIDELKPLEEKVVFFDGNDLNLERGVYQLSRVTLSSRFPLGLFYSWRYHSCDITLKVTPKSKEGSLALVTHSQLKEEGVGLGYEQIGTDEYTETRDHLWGEGFSRIDKKQSLRLGRPQIRVFEDEKATSQCFDLRGGSLEDNLSIAYYLVAHLGSKESFSLIFPNGLITKNNYGENHKLEAYETLSSYERPKVLLR